MNNTLKYGLMGVIAVGLIANAYLLMTGAYSDGSNSPKPQSSVAATSTASKSNNVNKLDASKLDASTVNKDAAIEAGPLTEMSFATPAHNFGAIKQDTENRHVFTFTNTGTEPLIIENAKGSCGCTVPQYPKEPVAPGETGEIEVVYKPGKQKNKQTKTVTITANTEPRTTTLTITAEVEEV